jgi:SEC-C motif-containing protein
VPDAGSATPCPCGSGALLSRCCAPLIDGSRAAADALALMRSRYTAYTQLREDYLLATWHPATRPAALDLHRGPAQKWLDLKVLRHESDVAHAERAVVEFVARSKVGGRAQRLHEVSRFVRENGHWYYIDGAIS